MLSVRWMGWSYVPKYGVPVSGGIIRSIRASGKHTPGEAVVSVVAHPADGSSA